MLDHFFKYNGESESEEESERNSNFDIVKEQIAGIEIKFRLPSETKIKLTLFASQVWNGARIIARFLQDNPNLVKGKDIIEFGSGTGLPGIMAALRGAEHALLTDYPTEHLIKNLHENLLLNLLTNRKRYNAMAHEWGESCEDLKIWNGSGFDMAIASECIWYHKLHENLLHSISSAIKPGGLALVTFSHHIPGCESKDLNFFTLAKNKFNFTAAFIESFDLPSMWAPEKQQRTYLYKLTRHL